MQICLCFSALLWYLRRQTIQVMEKGQVMVKGHALSSNAKSFPLQSQEWDLCLHALQLQSDPDPVSWSQKTIQTSSVI